MLWCAHGIPTERIPIGIRFVGILGVCHYDRVDDDNDYDDDDDNDDDYDDDYDSLEGSPVASPSFAPW